MSSITILKEWPPHMRCGRPSGKRMKHLVKKGWISWSENFSATRSEHQNDSDEAWIIIDELTDSFRGWVIDSDASRHMPSDESVFIIKRAISNTVTVVNDEILKVQGIDEIMFDWVGQSIKMKNVLYVSNLDANLLSISAKGFLVLFTKSGIKVRGKDTLVVIGIFTERMYFLRTVDTALWIIEGESEIPGNSIKATSIQQKVEPTRRSTRITQPYNRYQYDNRFGRSAHISDLSPDQKDEPSTHQEAVTGQDQRLWKVVITEQLNAVIAN